MPNVKMCFLDVETTGTDPALHSVIQIAVRLVEKKDWTTDHVIRRETWDTLVLPWPGSRWDEASKNVHGFDQCLLEAEHAIPHQTAHVTLINLLDRWVKRFDRADKLYIVGYNVKFDEAFMRSWFTAAGDLFFGSYFRFPSLDVAQMAAIALHDARGTMPDFRLSTVYQEARRLSPVYQGMPKLDVSRLHDAQYDLELTEDLFHWLI